MDNMTSKPSLTHAEADLVDWQYNALPGFKHRLWQAFEVADSYNLARLALAYPDEVEAFRRFGSEQGYWHELRERAERLGYI